MVIKGKNRILVTNGRSPITLDLIRSLANQGHEIYIVETHKLHLCAYSNAVKKSFVIPSPSLSKRGYVDELIKIIERHNINFFLPTWEDIFLVSKYLGLFPTTCKVFVSHFSLLKRLHHKDDFIRLLEELKISTPKTIRVEKEGDLQKVDFFPFALKACFSRSSQNVYKVEKGETFPSIQASPDAPWVAQEWLEGNSFCTFSLCQNGKVMAHACYPVDFVLKKKTLFTPTVGSFCLSFRTIRHEKILLWVQQFVEKTHFTGQIAFDFIETNKGLFAIECNPRITSGVTLFSPNDGLDQALLGQSDRLIEPHPLAKRQILHGMLFYGWKSALGCKKMGLYFKNLLSHKDLIFHKKDLKPFFLLPLLQISFLIRCLRYKKRLIGAFSHDLDFNGDV